MAPHILIDGCHLSRNETSVAPRAAGLLPIGPVAIDVAAPDEGKI